MCALTHVERSGSGAVPLACKPPTSQQQHFTACLFSRGTPRPLENKPFSLNSAQTTSVTQHELWMGGWLQPKCKAQTNMTWWDAMIGKGKWSWCSLSSQTLSWNVVSSFQPSSPHSTENIPQTYSHFYILGYVREQHRLERYETLHLLSTDYPWRDD